MAGRNGGAPLSEVVEEARALMLRDPDVTAVTSSMPARSTSSSGSGSNRWRKRPKLRIEHGRACSWKLVRAAEELMAGGTRRESFARADGEETRCVEQWSI